MGYLSKSGLQILWTQILNLLKGKVDVVDGKGLSTNDYTTEEKEKLAELSSVVVKQINFIDGSAVAPNVINYYGSETMQEIVDMLRNSAKYDVTILRMCILPNDVTNVVKHTNHTLIHDDSNNVIGAKIFYGDNLRPVILDIPSNKIIFDPDWVAPSEPEKYVMFRSIKGETTVEAFGTEWLWGMVDGSYSGNDLHMEHVVIDNDKGVVINYDKTGYEVISLVYDDNSNPIQYIVKFYFGDNACPVIVDLLSQEITLDPDWVAPEVLPETSEAHQMLVTDGDGNKVWEERIIRPPEGSVVTIIPEQTVVPDYENSGGSAFITEAPIEQLIAGETYIVNWNGTEYKVVAQNVTENGITLPIIGDIDLMTGSGSTGEPFIIYTVPDDMIESMNGARVVVAALDQSASVTFKVDKDSMIYHRLPYEYLPEDLYRTGRGETILLPTNTPTLTDDGYTINVPLKQELVLGETYTVVWNGVAYECEYKSLTETTEDGAVVNANFLGTESIFDLPSTSDVPFTIVLYMTIGGINMMPEGVYGMCMPTDETTEITLSISRMSEVVYKVPDKYLPPKTHWVNEEDKIILPETTFTGLSSGGTVVNANLNYDLEVGVQYTVVWNGTEYTSTAQAPRYNTNMTKVVLGNGEAFGGTYEDVPYCFAVLTSEGIQTVGYPYYISSSDAEATMKIIEPVGTVHKLDAKFLPLRSINGKTGDVILTADDLEAVPITRTINNHNLSHNIVLTAKDVGAPTYIHDSGAHGSIEGLGSISAMSFSFAFGKGANTKWHDSVAIGSGTAAVGVGSSAFGTGTIVNGAYGTAIGKYNNDIDPVGFYYKLESNKYQSFFKERTYQRLISQPTQDINKGVFIYELEETTITCDELKVGDLIYFSQSCYFELLELTKSYDEHIVFRVNMHVIYNNQATNGSYVFCIGNGISDTIRSNAHTLDWDGNAWYQGDVYTGGTSQDDAERLAKVSEITAPRDHLALTDKVTGKVYEITIENGNLIATLVEGDE